jgi:hypothetical protein
MVAGAMPSADAVSEIHGEPAERTGKICGLPQQDRIVGIQHQQSLRVDGAGDHQLHSRQIVEVVYAVFAEVIGGDVGDDGGICMRDRQTTAQHSAARGFQNRRLRMTLAQRGACAGRTGKIPGLQRLVVEIHAIGATVRSAPAVGFGHRRQQAHGGGFTVGASD